MKNAALLALIGTAVLTVLLLVKLIINFTAYMNGLTPAIELFSWLVYTFAALTLAVFFYVFHRSQA